MEATALARHGVAEDPNIAATATPLTVTKVIKAYVEAGYPDKSGTARPPGRHLEEEKRYCEILLKYFNADAPVTALTQGALDDYRDWRVKRMMSRKKKDGSPVKLRGNGSRAVDLELNCLNNALRWALRKDKLRENPLAGRIRFRRSSEVRHCRAFSMESIEELHQVAGLLMSSRQSEVLGWLLLVEANTGLRSEEAVLLRMCDRSDEPGGLTADGRTLCVARAKKSQLQNTHVEVHPGLREILDAHIKWHHNRYPRSQWYFPGRDADGGKHVCKGSLSSALNRLYQAYATFVKAKQAAQQKRNRGKELEPEELALLEQECPTTPYLAKKYTSHGAGRAFYVYVRRSQGIEDAQIAYEINHTGGVTTLSTVYGLPAKHWRDGKGPNMSWTPKGKRAWANIKPPKKKSVRR